ncbi:centromere protein S [Biomphalaria pfeifferi]|uniref:Centromere protein S n=1 Tax=Biomphalaria pfeifferi TaxID=112525 RepID=A0AAD8FFD4_BIOPF|nr:centromere protein S [Biomphalaria pfeifferi]
MAKPSDRSIGEEFDSLPNEQKLKAAMYYSIKEIAKEVEQEMQVSISAQVLATVSESLNRQAEYYALDLENFAKHAKRTTINTDDVKLLARRNDTLLQHLNEILAEETASKTASKPIAKATKKAKKSAKVADSDIQES